MDARLRGGPAWRGGALGGILVAAVAIVVVVGLAGRQPAGAPPGAVPSERATGDPALPSVAPPAAATAVPSVPVAPSVPVVPLRPAASPLGYGLDGSGWFQLDAPDDGTGAITRYVLIAGRLGWVGSFTVELPNPAFAAGPFGDQILYGGDDGTRSEIAVLSVADGSRRVLLTSAQPVWRATLDRDAAHLYYVLLDRVTREDLGIWRLRLDGSTKSELVMAPPAWVAELQPVTAVEFVWGATGDALAVYACGLGVGCRTRVLDVATGKVRSYDEVPLLGDIIGVTSDAYIAYENCSGFPCRLTRVDLATGTVDTLVDEAGPAVLVLAATGPLVVYEVPYATGYRLMGLDLTTSATRQVYLGPMDGPSLASSIKLKFENVGLPADWLLLGPYGDVLPIVTGLPKPQVVRIGDGVQVQLIGVSR